MTRFKPLVILICASLVAPLAFAEEPMKSGRTQIAMLGTGTPNPFPDRSGPSIAIVVNDQAYLVDFGPGVVRQAAALSPEFGGNIPGLAVSQLKHAFLTHLHSDHSVGFPDLLFTSWTQGRDTPLTLVGPEGVQVMADGIHHAYQEDISYRLYGQEPANNQGWRVNAIEISEPGLVYEDDNIKVEAFNVPHGSWPNALGYRFTTPDKVIVISGDTAPSETLTEYATGADVLIHEVYSLEGFKTKEPKWQRYHAKNHTSTHELAEIAKVAQPGLVILYHQLFWGSTHEQLLKEMAEIYDGPVVSARDLDVY